MIFFVIQVAQFVDPILNLIKQGSSFSEAMLTKLKCHSKPFMFGWWNQIPIWWTKELTFLLVVFNAGNLTSVFNVVRKKHGKFFIWTTKVHEKAKHFTYKCAFWICVWSNFAIVVINYGFLKRICLCTSYSSFKIRTWRICSAFWALSKHHILASVCGLFHQVT